MIIIRGFRPESGIERVIHIEPSWVLPGAQKAGYRIPTHGVVRFDAYIIVALGSPIYWARIRTSS